jgi:release factor glutamine methyltransferase
MPHPAPKRPIENYERSLARCTASRSRADRPRTFALADREWDLLGDVFAPIDSPSTRIGLEFLGLNRAGAERPPTGTFLEIGSGAGVIAVCAALAGCTVTAADINEAAVLNTRLNARRHGRQNHLRSVHSDLFTALPESDRFDTVFWSSNYVLAPEGFNYRSVAERAYVDPGYAAHRRYLAEAPLRTTSTGRALLHFSSRGSLTELCGIADECGRELVIREFRAVLEGEDVVDHLLLEIRVRADEPAAAPVPTAAVPTAAVPTAAAV